MYERSLILAEADMIAAASPLSIPPQITSLGTRRIVISLAVDDILTALGLDDKREHCC